MLPFSTTLEHIQEAISMLEEEREKEFCDKLDPAFNQEYDDDIELMEEPDFSELPEEEEGRNPKADTGMFRPINTVDKEQMIFSQRKKCLPKFFFYKFT